VVFYGPMVFCNILGTVTLLPASKVISAAFADFLHFNYFCPQVKAWSLWSSDLCPSELEKL